MDKYTRSKALYVLSVPAWMDWITPFLTERSTYPDLVFWEPGAKRPVRLDAAIERKVVMLSYHSTLQRDAEYAKHHSNTVAQPCHMAAIAHDKTAMAAATTAVADLNAITELTPSEVEATLRATKGQGVIYKKRAGTEGDGFGLIKTESEWHQINNLITPSEYIFQPCLVGEEYSVNLLCDGKNSLLYEPVAKGSNANSSLHPAKRKRVFPAPLCREEKNALIKVAADYAAAIGAFGLLEIEFIVVQGRIYLIEVNPRLAATLRMCISASPTNLLLELANLKPGSLQSTRYITANQHSVEIPLLPNLSDYELSALAKMDNVHLSSRITITSPDATAALALVERLINRTLLEMAS
mgnify:CR=1 FL=1